MKYIKQFGLQRSGTNAVKALIELNFKNVIVLSNYLGNKHEATSWEIMSGLASYEDVSEFGLGSHEREMIKELIVTRTLPVVINVKEPVSWLNSYYKYQRKKVVYRNPNAEFNFSVEFSKKALTHWSENVDSWLKFHINSDNSILFRHEDVLRDMTTRMREIKDKFDLEMADCYPIGTIDGYAKRGTDKQHGEELINKNASFDRNYHLDGGWRKDVPDEVLEYADQFSQDFFDTHPEYLEFFC